MKIAILWFFLVLTNAAFAVDPVCGYDVNGDSFIDSVNEIAQCINEKCPLHRKPCIKDGDGSYQCPYGEEYLCSDLNGVVSCSDRPCVNEEAIDETAGIFDDTWHQDDGKRDEEGQCLGRFLIFSGKPSRCLPAGKSTAYKNCCKNSNGDIYFDSSGSNVESVLTSKALTATIKAAGAAAKASATAIQAGATAAEAAQAGTAAAQNVLTVAFNPTTIIIAVVIALIMDYLMQACDQQSMETAMLNSSGYCVPIGSYCHKEWSGFGCVQKANSFCCFNSKLARIFHEQGRSQLSSFEGETGFGTPNSPNCRGFTPEEFQSLDFAKIDLSEYMEELKIQSQDVINANVNQKIEAFTSDENP